MSTDAIRADIATLIEIDPLFDDVPPVTRIPLMGPGFVTLIKLILGQQVSLEAARAMFHRLESSLGAVTPETIQGADDDLLRSAGFTASKQRAAIELAKAAASGELDFDRLASSSDADAIAELVSHHGIGPWTAQNYLLFGEGRRDIFPSGDLALRKGWAELAETDVPSIIEIAAIAEGWAPRRTAAAFLLWSYYLAKRARPWPS